MSNINEPTKINLLLDQLYKKMTQYRESLIKDEIFEVRKEILLQIKQLQKEIMSHKMMKP